jgi:hypothetical protein
MTRIIVDNNSKRAWIVGHGITLQDNFQIAPGVSVIGNVPQVSIEEFANGADDFSDYAACLSMSTISSFALMIEDEAGGPALVAKTWNALWLFGLLSLACSTHCISLYCISGSEPPKFSIANRNRVIHASRRLVDASIEQFKWSAEHYERYNVLIKNERFSTALRYMTNAHYLFDFDARIMLLWAGIEGLLDVGGELRNRIALHASIMLDGDADTKQAYFRRVRAAYDTRSKVVHGSARDKGKIEEGYNFASEVLTRLLAKCVELGRVPTQMELDHLAISPIMK